jgi:hypothetical protein
MLDEVRLGINFVKQRTKKWRKCAKEAAPLLLLHIIHTY